MPLYSYICDTCNSEFLVSKGMKDATRKERCPECMTKARRVYDVSVIGTRDSFGVGKAFVDKKSGKEITTWKEWERAGYTDAFESVKGMPDTKGDKNFILERMKEKKDKISHKEKKHITVGGK